MKFDFKQKKLPVSSFKLGVLFSFFSGGKEGLRHIDSSSNEFWYMGFQVKVHK